jgi:hypothetical protein
VYSTAFDPPDYPVNATIPNLYTINFGLTSSTWVPSSPVFPTNGQPYLLHGTLQISVALKTGVLLLLNSVILDLMSAGTTQCRAAGASMYTVGPNYYVSIPFFVTVTGALNLSDLSFTVSCQTQGTSDPYIASGTCLCTLFVSPLVAYQNSYTGLQEQVTALSSHFA